MSLFHSLFPPGSLSYTLMVIFATCAAGLAIGGIRIFRVKFGIAGVLFAGILFGHMGFQVNPEISHFIREFGLILFVYSIGNQVGPGFFSSFRKHGIKLNLLAASIVLGGVAMVLLLKKSALFNNATLLGMYSGSVTNTPSLGAAQQMMKSIKPALVDNISVGYALAYPGAIIGIILSMLFMRLLFRREAERDIRSSGEDSSSRGICTMSIKVENPNLDGIAVSELPAIGELGILVSRIMRGGEVFVACGETTLKRGDIILSVGKRENLEKFVLAVGSKSDVDIKKVSTGIVNSRIVVTRKDFIGRKIRDLDIQRRHNVTITRISRAEIEFIASGDNELQFGDNLVVVGSPESIAKVAEMLGNSPKDLNHPNLLPVLLGMGAGVVIGSIPFYIPGLSSPVKLGLAGGPLIAAIVLSYVQHIGTLSWYIPPSSNLMMRELGIVLFLSCVGLKAGNKFFEVLLYGGGLRIVLFSFLITTVPLLLVGLAAKIRYKTDYLSLCGLMSGSMTDPPALAFAGSLSPSPKASVAYSTVYPLVMIMRIISAQILVINFFT